MFNEEEINIIENMLIDTRLEITHLKKDILHCENTRKLNNLLEQYYNLRNIENKLKRKVVGYLARKI